MAEPGVSRSATRMLDFDATNVAGEICDSEMTVTLRKARDITAARCARRANVPATNRTRNEMSSLFSIHKCETLAPERLSLFARYAALASSRRLLVMIAPPRI